MRYSLAQVLIFFDSQSYSDFETIKEVLHIIDSDKIETELKQELIIYTLRLAGFFDDDFIQNMPKELRKKITAEYEKKAKKL